MIDCNNCKNRGQVNGLTQETFCESCIYSGSTWKKNNFKAKEEMPQALGFHFKTLAEIEHKEDLQNKAATKWLSSGEFKFLHNKNRVELLDYIHGCNRVIADLQAEILRLRQT